MSVHESSGGHLNDEQLIARLYDVPDPATQAHLVECGECLERYETIEHRRAQVTALRQPSAAELARQRAAVLTQIESPPGLVRRAWVPALAAALLIGAGLFFTRPAEVPSEAAAAPAMTGPAGNATDVNWYEDDWYADVYGGIDLMEPRAATPIRELFEEELATE